MILQCIIGLDYGIINFGQFIYWASEKGFYKSSFVWASQGEAIWSEFSLWHAQFIFENRIDLNT